MKQSMKQFLKPYRWLIAMLTVLIVLAPLMLMAQVTGQPTTSGDASETVPVNDIVNALIWLAKNWKALSPLAISGTIITIVVMFLKSSIGYAIFKKVNPIVRTLIVLILGQASGIILMITNGMTVWQALSSGLISSGFAIVLWKLIKPLIPANSWLGKIVFHEKTA